MKINRINLLSSLFTLGILFFFLSDVFSQERAFFVGAMSIFFTIFVVLMMYTFMEFIIAKQHNDIWKLGFLGIFGILGLFSGFPGFFALFVFFAFFGLKE